MADEINPRTGKPYSKNPRAVSARRKRQLKVSEAANERQAELDLQQPENQPGTGNILTPEQIEINKKGLEEAKKKIREGGTVKIPEDGKNPLMIKGTEMSPEMKETYKNNPGYPKFNKETERVIETTKRGSKERLQGLKENIGNYGRLAIKNANPTGIVVPILTGAASLMIKGMQRQLLGI